MSEPLDSDESADENGPGATRSIDENVSQATEDGAAPEDAERKPSGKRKYVRYSEALARHICEQVAQGIGLTTICKRPGMPGTDSVWRWYDSIPEFGQMVRRAQCFMAFVAASNLTEKAYAPMVTFTDQHGVTRGDPAAARLRDIQLYNDRWMLKHLLPRDWGDTLELTGPDGGPLVAPDLIETARKIAYLLKTGNEAVAGVMGEPPAPSAPLALPAPRSEPATYDGPAPDWWVNGDKGPLQ